MFPPVSAFVAPELYTRTQGIPFPAGFQPGLGIGLLPALSGFGSLVPQIQPFVGNPWIGVGGIENVGYGLNPVGTPGAWNQAFDPRYAAAIHPYAAMQAHLAQRLIAERQATELANLELHRRNLLAGQSCPCLTAQGLAAQTLAAHGLVAPFAPAMGNVVNPMTAVPQVRPIL